VRPHTDSRLTPSNYLVQHGLTYDASLMGDDILYMLDNGAGSVVELPSHYAMDDWAHYMVARDLGYMMPIKAPSHALDAFREEFDAAWEFGGLWIAVWHPTLTGRPARFAALIKLIRHMLEKGNVWFAKLEDIAAYVRNVVADGSWQPRLTVFPTIPGRFRSCRGDPDERRQGNDPRLDRSRSQPAQ
jgi:hypothetical protein